MPSLYTLHRDTWSKCQRCELARARHHVVLARGSVPAEVVFTGEAPGIGEDRLNKPFIGPAGKLLDAMIKQAGFEQRFFDTRPVSVAFTNLIACIPLTEEGDKVHEPPKESIEACAPRLLEFIDLAKPRLIVRVGQHATKWLPKLLTAPRYSQIRYVDIVHPASILRADISQQGLAIQKTVIILADALAELTLEKTPNA